MGTEREWESVGLYIQCSFHSGKLQKGVCGGEGGCILSSVSSSLIFHHRYNLPWDILNPHDLDETNGQFVLDPMVTVMVQE